MRVKYATSFLNNNNAMTNNGNSSTVSNVINNEYKRQSYFNTDKHSSTTNMRLFKASNGNASTYRALSAKNEHMRNQLTGNKRIRYVKNNKHR